MAVRPSTASESLRTGPQGPIRTCVGCRSRAAATELLRVVVAPGGVGSGNAEGTGAVALAPDPRHRAPGRGAWLHPDPGCLDLAERRRAFARALRVPGPTDPTAVREYVTETTR